jgi:hypothetical protein
MQHIPAAQRMKVGLVCERHQEGGNEHERKSALRSGEPDSGDQA